MTPGAPTAAMLLPVSAHGGFVAAFVGAVAVLLVADLALFHKRPRAVGWGAALAGVGFWVALALAFNALVWALAQRWLAADPAQLVAAGRLAAADAANDAAVRGASAQAALELGLQWLAGYVVEVSLSVDNLFVFVVVLRHFAVPAALQHRVLFWGILGAVALRAAFIAAGVEVLHRFEWVAGAFGAFLALTGLKMLAMRADDELVDPARSPGFRALRRVLPLDTAFAGDRFFARIDRRVVGTPMLAALVVIEFSDVVFAVDSVPAVLAITREPIIAFTSNIAAVLGLRAMYFLLANAVDRFHLLQPALGVVLAFVGGKMAWQWWTGSDPMPVAWSLAIVLGTVALGIVASLATPPRGTPAARP